MNNKVTISLVLILLWGIIWKFMFNSPVVDGRGISIYFTVFVFILAYAFLFTGITWTTFDKYAIFVGIIISPFLLIYIFLDTTVYQFGATLIYPFMGYFSLVIMFSLSFLSNTFSLKKKENIVETESQN